MKKILMSKHIIIYFLIIILFLISGCKKIEIGNIPFCNDINVMGLDCYSPELGYSFPFHKGTKDLNWSEGICKKWIYVGFDEHISVCFDTLVKEDQDPQDSLSLFDPNKYCYVDDSKSYHCTCDVLIFPDGHNETRNCQCYDDLVLHYTCINRSGIKIIEGVEM